MPNYNSGESYNKPIDVENRRQTKSIRMKTISRAKQSVENSFELYELDDPRKKLDSRIGTLDLDNVESQTVVYVIFF